MKLLSKDLGRLRTTLGVPPAETPKPIEQTTTTPCGQVVRIDLSHTASPTRRLEKTMANKPQEYKKICPKCGQKYKARATWCKTAGEKCGVDLVDLDEDLGVEVGGEIHKKLDKIIAGKKATKKKATKKKATKKKATKKKATETPNTNTFERQAAYRQEFFRFKREISMRATVT